MMYNIKRWTIDMFIEYIFLLCWSGYAPPQGERDRKPTTAGLEPQGTSVSTWSECRTERPEQCNTI